MERRRLAPVVAPTQVAGEADAFLAWLLNRAGVDAQRYRSKALHRRLSACLRALEARDLADARRCIETDPDLTGRALDVMLLGVTGFYRDTAVFDCMRQQVIPELKSQSTPLGIWSAACSQGHELYSVAMLLADAEILGRCRLLGTDVRLGAIERAKSAMFSRDELEEVALEWQTRYFRTRGLSAQVVDEVAGVIVWKTADLLRGCESGPWDMILWRNMAIYLRSHAADDVWRELVDELRPGGWLVVGKAEQPPASLPVVRVAPCIYRKTDAPTKAK